jgi:hypothetical protein
LFQGFGLGQDFYPRRRIFVDAGLQKSCCQSGEQRLMKANCISSLGISPV